MTASTEKTEAPEQDTRDGLLSALIAYVIWGLLPIYLILIKTVSSYEVLAHRIVWAVPFGALIIHFRRQWPEVVRALSRPTMLKLLCVTALLIAGNWFVYIIAVQQEQIFQASLGYYINPLLFAVVGIFVLGEQLRLPQTIAVLLAGTGVLVLTFSGGQFPSIALFLGVSFTIYGVIRKKVIVGGMPGLFVETIMLMPFAIVFLGWLLAQQQATFYSSGVELSVLLALAGPLTVIPLLFFALAARRLNLTTVGMMQFIAPTLQFLVGVYNGEVLTLAHLVCFTCIWAAVLLFSWDAWRNNRRNNVLVT